MISLSIIVVNYNSLSLIRDCLASLSVLKEKYAEVIIVDNSGDQPDDLLKEFPFIHWLPMNYNAGFARANNGGIRMAKGDTVLLLNPDVLEQNNAIAECYTRFKNSPYLACGVQLLNEDHTPQVSGSYFMKGGINHLLPLPFLGNLFKWMGEQLKVKKTSVLEATGPVEVDWINGAFLMVKKNAVEKAGLLDEDFFLYFEEIEWCARIRKLGKLCLYGDLHMIHLQGATANEAFQSEGKGYYNLFDKKGKQILISGMVRIRKQFGAGWFLFHLLVLLGEIPVFFFGVLFQQMFSKKPLYSFRHVNGYCRNLFHLLRLTPRILSGKPYFYKVI